MSDPFAHLIKDARTYLAELAANNSRDWFQDHKARYDSELKGPATALLDAFSGRIGKVAGTKLFRPQRDIRFSKDKTPYHTHLHMVWMLPRLGSLNVGFFFGISPDYVGIGGGAMTLDKSGLAAWRSAIDSPTGGQLSSMLTTLTSQGFELAEPELKRVPAPFDKDHPHGALLRRKSITLWRDLPESKFATPLAALSETYQCLEAFEQLLSTNI